MTEAVWRPMVRAEMPRRWAAVSSVRPVPRKRSSSRSVADGVGVAAAQRDPVGEQFGVGGGLPAHPLQPADDGVHPEQALAVGGAVFGAVGDHPGDGGARGGQLRLTLG
jgi:hypothetical protein